jgi:hypothetical protein
MDGDRITGQSRRTSRSQRTGFTGVGDAAFDREIESLLGAEPSPEFVARVRARVADETPQGSRVGWRFSVAVASLALAVIVAFAIWLSNDGASHSSEQARSTVVERIPSPVEPERMASAPVAESPRPRNTRRTPRGTDIVAAERLVPVVNEEDGKAFDAFLATIRGGKIVLTFNESQDSALAASPVVIAPIAIDPLPDVLEGGVE